ncbi:MAG: hypothetical protein ACRD3T_17465 [Terriglobia bacterium]
MNSDLRPLSLGELLDQTFTFYREHFLLFVGIMAAPQAVILAANLLRDVLSSHALVLPSGLPGHAPPSGAGLGMAWLISTVMVLVVYLVGYEAALGGTTHSISQLYLGHPTDIRDSYRSIWGRLWDLTLVLGGVGVRILGLSVPSIIGFIIMMVSVRSHDIAGILAGLLLLLLGLPLVYILSLRYGVAVPAFVIERVSPSASIDRSTLLTQGYLGRLIVITILIALVSFVAAVVFEFPVTILAAIFALKAGHNLVWLVIPMQIAGSVSQVLTSPLLVIALALAYYDMRIRKEGLDLELMMSSLDDPNSLPSTSAAAWPSTS